MHVNKRQAEDSASGNRKRRSNDSKTDQKNDIFANISVYFLPTGIGKTRLNILKSGVQNNGGCVVEDCQHTSKLTHVVADDSLNYDRIDKLVDLSRLHKSTENDLVCAKISWVCECLRQKSCVDVQDYRFTAKKLTVVTKIEGREEVLEAEAPKTKADEKLSEIGGSGVKDDQKPTPSKIGDREFSVKKASFACSQSSGQQKSNLNQHITDKLEALAVTFKTNKDHWRAMSYQHAVSALKNYPKEVTSWEEAKAIPRVGERLADKIWEIIESGRLRKMEEICNSETNEALNLFMNIWGVGPNTAQIFVQQGFRTLEDIEAKADLNRQQRIGLKHYWDILDRMLREEAAEIERTVKETALNIQSGLEIMACGSYRRGNATCGDVDMLITHPDGKSHENFLAPLLTALHLSGFLTDDLVSHDRSGHQHKYLGVCKLPGEHTKHRRLDIIVVPHSEFACSLLYFTGSAHFNRSMRLLARKMGMTLSEHSLNSGVVRRGQERICNGTPLPTPTEESVFEHLGLPYRPPEERNH